MIVLCASLLIASTALPPLTAAQRVALATAIDDRDHQESAFAALAEAMLELDVASVDANELAPLDSIDWDHALDDPDSIRGDAVLLTGRLDQSDPLPRPWGAFTEWFLRAPSGRVFAVYVPLEDDRKPGAGVRVAARFYKRIQAEARDGTIHRYPALVGRPLAVESVSYGGGLIVLFVIALLGCWLLLRFVSRGGRSSVRVGMGENTRSQEDEEQERPGDLPTDAAEALDELARRSEDPSRGGDQ